jgi:hypothetical protein
MWATLTLATALSLTPSQSGQLELKNARATYGILGPERKDNKVLPGDTYVVSFDIDNLTMKEDGLIRYSMGMELTREGKDRPEYKSEPQEKETINTLGGSRLPSFARAEIGLDTKPGNYTLKVTVIDPATKTTKTLTSDFTVVPVKFGFAQVGFFYTLGDSQNRIPPQPAPPLAVPGQTLILNFALVGFGLEKAPKEAKRKQPNFALEATITDDSGKPVLPKPFTVTVAQPLEDPRYEQFMPFNIPIQANRPGKFKIHLKATDKVNSKTVELPLDLAVTEVK